MSDFNANSSDAVFSRIMERLDVQNTVAQNTRAEFLAILGEIRDEVKKTNGRVRSLETWRTEVRAKYAVIAALVSAGVAWLVNWFSKR